jgi:hypothetical protein
MRVRACICGLGALKVGQATSGHRGGGFGGVRKAGIQNRRKASTFLFCGNEVCALAIFLDGNAHSLSIAPLSRTTRTKNPSAAATQKGREVWPPISLNAEPVRGRRHRHRVALWKFVEAPNMIKLPLSLVFV